MDVLFASSTALHIRSSACSYNTNMAKHKTIKRMDAFSAFASPQVI